MLKAMLKANKFRIALAVTLCTMVLIAQQPTKPVDAGGSAMTTTQGGTAPASQLSVGCTYNTSLPSLSTGQASQLQCDSSGRPLVNVGAGTLAVTGTFNPTPQSTSTYALSDFDLSATAATNVKASAGNVWGFYGFNPNATTCFLQFYNSTSATLGTSPLHPFGILAGASFVYTSPLALANYSTGISTGQTTTATGSTQCGSPMVITILYN